MAGQQSTLEELGGTVQSAAARLLAAQQAQTSNLHPTIAAALAPFVTPGQVIVPEPPQEESEIDRALRVLYRAAVRMTDRQLSDLGDVFRAALCSAEDGEVCRHFDSDGLDELLSDAREFDPEPIGPDYETIDAPYMTEREQAALDDRAAHAYGAERLGEAAL